MDQKYVLKEFLHNCCYFATKCIAERWLSVGLRKAGSWCYKTFFGGNLDFPKIKELKNVCSDV